MFDITPYLIGFLSLLALFFATWLIPMIKSKTTAQQQEIICSVTETVVFAAEKLFGALHGDEKLAYAIDQAVKRLEKYGIKLDASALRPYIESAVMALDLRKDISQIGFSDPVPGLADFLRSDDEGKDE